MASGYERAGFAPGRNLGDVAGYTATHNVLRAHAQAYRIYQREFKQKQRGKLSLAVNFYFSVPANASDPADIAAAERVNQFKFGSLLHPIYSEEGGYPRVMSEYIEKHSFIEGRNQSKLPYFTQEDNQEIKGSSDFIALNYYSSVAAKTEHPSNSNGRPQYTSDYEAIREVIPGLTYDECNILQIYPEGLRLALNWIKRHYGNHDVFITENGYCGKDKYIDNERIKYHEEHLKNILFAIHEDGCRVMGYIVWSLMDDFEWTEGYINKYGLMKVDFNSPRRERIMRYSTTFIKALLKAK